MVIPEFKGILEAVAFQACLVYLDHQVNQDRKVTVGMLEIRDSQV